MYLQKFQVGVDLAAKLSPLNIYTNNIKHITVFGQPPTTTKTYADILAVKLLCLDTLLQTLFFHTV